MIEDFKDVALAYSANFRNRLSVKDCTQAELAELLGVSQGSVSQWASGKMMPSLPMARAIAQLFGTTVSEMLGEVEAETYENSGYERYRFLPETFDRAPLIDTKEVESMEYLHDKGIVKDDEYMSYLTKKIKEIMA